MTGPQRIQRRRTRGWKMPPGAVYVGRGTRWGNPYLIAKRRLWAGGYGDCHVWTVNNEVPPPPRNEHLTLVEAQQLAADCYRAWIIGHGEGFVAAIPLLLGGRDLACWCPEGTPCHGDVLLKIANEPRPRSTLRVVSPEEAAARDAALCHAPSPGGAMACEHLKHDDDTQHTGRNAAGAWRRW